MSMGPVPSLPTGCARRAGERPQRVCDIRQHAAGSCQGPAAHEKLKTALRVSRRLAAGFLLSALVLAAPGLAREPSPVAVISQTVPLDPKDATRTAVGRLEYRGGIAIRSDDARFGGFSALVVGADGRRLLAVSDRGHWLRATIVHDGTGRLAGLRDGAMGSLHGPDGTPLAGDDADAEAMAVLHDGSILVAFERRHRFLLYPPEDEPLAGVPRRYPAPVGLDAAPRNGGVEALTHVGSRYVVAITERMPAGGGALAAWVGRDGIWEPMAYRPERGFRPSALAMMPSGDLLLVERRFTATAGSAVRLVGIRRDAIAPGEMIEGVELARLEPPLTVDNFEGIAVREAEDGETLVYLLSDDNFSPLQRTLLLMFALR